VKLIRKSLAKSDGGSSLAEVIIGVVVLGVVGMSLLGGINTSQLSQRKMAQVAFAENALQIGSDKLAKIGFSACNTSNTNPYSAQTLPTNETIKSVSVWSDLANTWVPCSSWINGTSGAQYKQKITIAYTDYSMSAQPRTRDVVKLVLDTANKMGNNCNYAVNAIASLGIVAGDTQSSLSPLSTTCADVADTIWNTLVPGVTGITASIDPGTYTLTLSAASSTVAGNYSLAIGAHDAVTATAAQNAALAYTVWPTITLATGTKTDWVALEGCGIMPPPSAEDNLYPTRCSVYNAAASTGARSFTLAGGNPASPVAFQSTTSSAGVPWKVVNTVVSGKNTGVLTYDPAISGSGTYPINFTAVGGGLSSTMKVAGGFNIVTRPKLAVDYGSGTSIDLTAKSGCTSFWTTTSTCSVAIKTLAGTGYIQRIGANGYAPDVTYSAATPATVTSSSIGAFGYSTYYSGTVSIKHGTGSGLCFGKGATSSNHPTDTATIGYLNDYATGLAIPVTVTVKC